jgi:hypothetical protein
MVNFIKGGITTAQYAVYFVIVFVIVYLAMQVVKAVIGFDVFFKWWNTNGGKAYKQGFDMMSFALFQESRLAFNIRQAFIPGQDRLNYTDIMLLQSIALNQARVMVNSDGNPQDGNFVLPHHVCQGIAWSSADNPVFQNLYLYWAKAASDAASLTTPDPQGGITPTTAGHDWPSKYANTKDSDGNLIGPEDYTWGTIADPGATGFWPHQNGCSGFFDMPGTPAKAVIPYDLLTNPARSVIGEAVSLANGTAPKYRDSKAKTGGGNDIYLQGFSGAGADNSVSMYYIPGCPGPQGSWAQLFADFGIIYTMSSLAGDSKVPVVSDGALCGGSDNSTPLDPCPASCDFNPSPKPDGTSISCGDRNKQSKATSMTGMPISDFNIWNGTSRWGPYGGSESSGVYGPNFFSAFRMDPQSYVFTSWVGNLYDDPTTGIVLDPQAIKNLVGMADPGIRGQTGGWIRFFKGINTDLKSYDEIMNQLFSKYATQFTARAVIQNTSKKCGVGGWLSSGISILGGLAMFVMCPEVGVIGGLLIGASALGSGVQTAMDKGCIPGGGN